MKRFVFATLTIFLSTQIFGQRSFRFGLKSAPNLAWSVPENDSYENDGLKLGFGYGAMGDFFIGASENYAINTGFLINDIGGKVLFSDIVESDDGTFFHQAKSKSVLKQRYVEVPVNLKMRTGEIGYMYYFGTFGITSGVHIKSSEEKESTYFVGNSEKNSTASIEQTGNVGLFRMGLNMSLGAEYNLTGNTNVVVEATYNKGFTNNYRKDVNAYEIQGGEVNLDSSGNPISGSRKKMLINYFALTVGIWF